MRAALSATVLLAVAALAVGDDPAPATRPSAQTQPSTRPAGVATTRRARPNATLSPERSRQFRAALAQLSKEGNPSVQAARIKLQDEKKKGDDKFQKDQVKSRDQALQAARREHADLYRRHPNWSHAAAEAQKSQAAQHDMQDAAAHHQTDTINYNRAMSELKRLEGGWMACHAYGLDLDYQQWYQADIDRKRVEAALNKPIDKTDPDYVLKLLEPIENSIREELRKLNNRDKSGES